MNQVVKQKWINALLGGEYEQGIGALKRGNQFCCLGVLCDIYIKEHKEIQWENCDECDIKEFSIKDVYRIFANTGILPTPIEQWAELNNADPWIIMDDQLVEISKLNDEHQLSFKEIAKLIDEHL